MSGETESDISGWTTDTLHELILTLLNERAKEWEARFDGQERALTLAREADLRNQQSLFKIIETRFADMDKATDVLSATVNRVPTDVDRQVGQLKAVHDEHFLSLEASLSDLAASMVVRFQERDTRSEREARDNKIAVDAAFAAAKEAVAENNKSSALANDKSEASFTKQIDALGSAVDSKFKATDDKIDDIKQQLSNRGGRDAAVVEARSSSQWSTTTVIGVVFGVLSLLVSTIVVIILITKG